MSTPTCVVVAYQFGQTGHVALSRAVALAAHEPGPVLHVVYVVEPGQPVPLPEGVGVQDALTAVIQQELGVANAPGVQFVAHVREGKPVDEIVGLARDVGANLIMVGHHHLTGIERLLVGSLSERIAREATCSVEIVREGEGRATLGTWPDFASVTTHPLS